VVVREDGQEGQAEGGCGVKGFSKRVEETGPKSVEAKKEIQVGAAAITTHRVPELNLLAASTGMAFLSLPAPCSDDGDGPPNALNAMRHPHLQRDVQPTTTRVDERRATSYERHTRTRTRTPTCPPPLPRPAPCGLAFGLCIMTPPMTLPTAPTLSLTHVHDAAAARQL
jgi:hypothetical protein